MFRNNRKKVFVGLSGGVDSSVAALLLKLQGYEVTGVFINVWQPPFLECTMQYDRRDAMRVCAELKIPFLECDGEEAYKTQVVDYMVSEYKKGRVPNPDVMCNKYVKFGVFYDFAMQRGADFVATGHYAQVKDGHLFISPDAGKDQSYFLWAVKKEMLEKTLFPVGRFKKPIVRFIARLFRLSTAKKKDSQGLCFLGKLDMKDFLKHFLGKQPGAVLDLQNRQIGTHDGALFYTYGERHGFTITKKSPESKPLYVVNKNIEANTITVAEELASAPESHDSIELESINIIDSDLWQKNAWVEAVYRYHGERLKGTLVKEGESWRVITTKALLDIAPGQSLVLYNGKECLGGGIIKRLYKA
jgi:tRNA-uridine 2-sulfurtransferase